jgi:hypothetical protein
MKQDISLREITHNGKTLYRDDLRVLAIIVEEMESPDPQLGTYIEGVSKSAVRDLMGYDNLASVKHRFDNLEDVNLVEQHKADDLPIMPNGYNPTYAVPTSAGKLVIERIDALPILVREKDIEKKFDQLLADYVELRRQFLWNVGRIIHLSKVINECDDISELEVGYSDCHLLKIGTAVTEMSEEASFTTDDDRFELLAEMADGVRETKIEKLLD